MNAFKPGRIISLSIKSFLFLASLILIFLWTSFGGKLIYPYPPQSDIARAPEISIDEDSGLASMEISVLIYNVAGLPWPIACGKKSRQTDANGERIPIRCNRSAAVKKIGAMLGQMRKQGTEPDVVLIQEAFLSASAQIPELAKYPNWVAGPDRGELGPTYSDRASEQFIAERKFWKGEKAGKIQSSGLLLASNFPIVELHNNPFNQWECAGFDCLANKGMLVVELEIPGLPDLLAVATTHFNARGASGVSNERALAAHNLQVDDANEFLENLERDHLPFIWGGDLNMRQADDRIEYFVERSAGTLNEVSSYCVDPTTDCEVRINWETDTPWYETQDLQGWVSGNQVSVEPVSVQALFDEPLDGHMASDHNGLLVIYRLSWPAETQLQP